ncbi:MAG: FecR domain-containing protein [Tannerellaceae bacterium]|jgi:YD repeat-containing protein|nr:FecR domain-containing protein [Tannerellaceae bacterium]
MDTDILQRYIEGNASQAEKEAVAKWLDAGRENRREFLLLRHMYDATLWSETESVASGKTVQRKLSVKIASECLKVAAIFLLAFAFCYFLSSRKEDLAVSQTVYTPEGQRTEITLTDGTQVILNAKTRFTFPNRFEGTERKVELDGEAYFKVPEDKSKPFIVTTRDYQIKVLGTEFNVNAYRIEAYFETALLKGSVEVISRHTSETIRLMPNQYVYTENKQLKLAYLQNHNHFLWREGIIAFEDEPITDVLEKMQLYYDIRIDVKNQTLYGERYSGKFRTKDGIEHVLKVLKLRYKFKYTRDNESNIITIYE